MRAGRHGARVQGDVGAPTGDPAGVAPAGGRGLLTRADDAHARTQPAGGRQLGQAGVPGALVLDRHLDAGGQQRVLQRLGQTVRDRQADEPAGTHPSRHDANDVGQGGALPGAHDDVDLPVAQDVALAGQARHVTVGTVGGPPGSGICHQGAAQLGQVGGVQLTAHGVAQVRHARVEGGGSLLYLSALTAGGLDLAEAQQVGGATRLGGGADGRALPAAEGLAAHDGPGDAAVDVEVSCLNTLEPDRQLGGVQGLDPGGEPVVDGVDRLDGLLKRVHAHHPDNGGEVLGEVELATGHDPGADARGPQAVTEVAGLEDPVLARSQGGQAAYGLLVVGHDDGPHLGVQGQRQAHPQGGGRIHELAGDALGGAGRGDQDQQRGGRALLAGVGEGRVDGVAHGDVGIGRGGDDDGVLATGLPQQVHIRLPGAEEAGGVVGTGEDHAVDVFVGHQVA